MIRVPRRRALLRASALLALLLLPTVLPATAPPADATDGTGAVAPARTPGRPDPVSPYLSLGWGAPPDPVEVMEATGVRWFTLAFVLSSGTCTPRWDGVRPLTGGRDERAIEAVRAAGGDVVASFGGGLGHKLERSCPSARALAGAYQEVIDAYGLSAIDVDIETGAYRDPQVRARTVAALRRVVTANPGLTLYVTLPSGPKGPDARLIGRAAEEGLEPDVWTIMPFAFGEAGWGRDMGDLTVRAAEGLSARLQRAYGYGRAEAYRHAGVSTMAGITGHGEVVTVRDFRTLVEYAERTGLGRLSFWSVNRDRKCPDDRYPSDDTCSGVGQRDWAYTGILAGYRGPAAPRR
ncbi:chitinase [Streptomyces sp. DSM 42041]|uniref:Chitinase n=1 Tax=Streptomyces hazeniae TaxID=3075538 RepID=A0ABU2NJT8_9ACTN|nr:chitinase [Streptomyces sp. DSM 42041]MDT0377188.1 chitinase [Streptomyces sp. DSM 42041]